MTRTRPKVKLLDLVKATARLPPKKWRMSFHPRRIFNIEVVAIAIIVFSVALICYVLLSLAGIIVEFPD